ncbi:uncharacterized protein JCM10292_005926 [Rhodotorula paludigena]|uniref:uncharacterized protein n=1 Tax=Rhodotorula paludigena TaxID=86838 RepID=UPI00317207BA
MLALSRALVRAAPRPTRVSVSPSLVRTLASSARVQLPRPPPPAPAKQRTRTADESPDPLDRDSYHLASLVRKAARAGKGDFSSALALVRNAGPEAATVVVWNGLINIILIDTPAFPGLSHAAAVLKASEVWMEMKRRGITPSARGYGTFLTGVAKRAKLAAEGATKGRAAVGWNAELRAKVDTVHKQWLVHCERVLTSGEAAGSSDDVGLEGVEIEGLEQDRGDGRDDAPTDLLAVTTNQYLAFLSSCLALATASSSASAAPTGPVILRQILSTFQNLPDADDPSESLARLAKTGMTYSLLFSSLRTALRASVAQSSAVAAIPAESAFPSPPVLLDTALSAWSHYLAHVPHADTPSPSSATSSPPTHVDPHVPTLLLSLFLIPPASSLSATYLPAALTLAQSAFGFVPPAEIASLEPPHPPSLQDPLCAPSPLDGAAFGTALRVAAASGKKEWCKSWWEMVRDYPARFGLAGLAESEAVRAREETEVVLRACGVSGDVEGIEQLLEYLLSVRLPSHTPTYQTYALALASLHRIGTADALSASLRVYALLLSNLGTDSGRARAHFADAAASVLRCAVSTRDRTGVWRALKAVSGLSTPSPAAPSSLSVVEPADKEHDRPFGPSCFPPSFSPATPPKEGQAALAAALQLALSRVVHSSSTGSKLDPLALGDETVKLLRDWEGRIGVWRDAAVREASGGGKKGEAGVERKEGESEMEWRRRVVALKRAYNPSSSSAPPHDRKPSLQSPRRDGRPSTRDGDRPPRPAREDGQPMHTERRRQWWAARQAEWAQEAEERERTGARNDRRERDGSSFRPQRQEGDRTRHREDGEGRPPRRFREEREERGRRPSFREDRGERPSRFSERSGRSRNERDGRSRQSGWDE